MIGAIRRAKRLFDPKSGRALLFSLDHGLNDGQIQGMPPLPELLTLAQDKGAQAVVLNKGMARAFAAALAPATPLVLQLSGGTRHGLPPYGKSLVCSVPEALRLGADAVALQVNIGNDLEDRMLADFAMATEEAHQLGIPAIAILYARGGQIVNERDPSLIAHCVRLGAELGADVVCVPYPGAHESFTAAVASCPVPVLVTGGTFINDFSVFLTTVRAALECGAAGVAVGRNVFLHPKPAKALAELLALVHSDIHAPGAKD